jgi:predicted metal-dependent HD superfamily phosphohydrolase
MLACLDAHRRRISDPLAVELAILFHDWIYEPQGKENEAESVIEFEAFAKQVGLDEGTRAKSARLIDATVKHQIPIDVIPSERSDLSFFLDFDLEVLARDWERYSVYAQEIRAEYSCYNDEEYRNGRIRVLKSFLTRERLFFSEEYFLAGEEAARQNMAKEIKMLEHKE